MEIKDLEYFITIADKGNLTAASKALYISQPALSKFLQKLEDQYEVSFFEKIGRHFKLTQAGESFYSYANKALFLAREMENDLKKLKNADSGSIRIGIPSLRANACLDIVLKQFRHEYPNISVEVMVKESRTLESLLNNGKIDLLFSLQNKKSENLTYEYISKEHVHVIVGEDSYLNEIGKKNNGLTVQDIKDENLLLQNPNQRTTERILALFSKNGLYPKYSEATNLITAATLASNGYGVSFLSDNLIRHYAINIGSNHYPLLDDEDYYFTVSYRSTYNLNIYDKKFIELMKNIYKE